MSTIEPFGDYRDFTDDDRHEAYDNAHSSCETCSTNVCKDKTCDCGSDLGKFDPESSLWFCANLTTCKRGRKNTLIGRALGAALLSGDGAFFVPPTVEGKALVDLVARVLSARVGEVLTPDVLRERAANVAQALMVTYRMEAI